MAGPYSVGDTRNYLGLGVQSAQGTTAAPTIFPAYIPSNESDHGLTINKIQESSGGNAAGIGEKVTEIPTGKFTVLCRPTIAAQLAALSLGKDTVTGSADPYTHVLTDLPATNYVSVEENLADDVIERFVDSYIHEITWTLDPSTRIIRQMCSWTGTKPSYISARTSDSYEATIPFTGGDGAFTIDSASATNVRAFTLTNRFVVEMPTLNDVIAGYIVKIRQEVDLSITQLMISGSAEYRTALYGSSSGTTYLKNAVEGAFTADFTNTQTTAKEMKLEVPRMAYQTVAKTPANPEGAVVEVTRTAFGLSDGTVPLFRYTAKIPGATPLV